MLSSRGVDPEFTPNGQTARSKSLDLLVLPIASIALTRMQFMILTQEPTQNPYFLVIMISVLGNQQLHHSLSLLKMLSLFSFQSMCVLWKKLSMCTCCNCDG